MKKLNPDIRRLAHKLHVPTSYAQLGYNGHQLHIRAASARHAGLSVGWFVDFACLGCSQAWLLFYPPDVGYVTRSQLRIRGGRWFVSSRSICYRLRQFAAGARAARFRFFGEPQRHYTSSGQLLCVVWQITTTPVHDIIAMSAEYHALTKPNS